MKNEIAKLIKDILAEIAKEKDLKNGTFDVIGEVKLDYPENLEHGDFTSNIAMVQAKNFGLAARALAEKIVEQINADLPSYLKEVSMAGPGFINFKLKDETIFKEVMSIGDTFSNVNSGSYISSGSFGNSRLSMIDGRQSPPIVLVEFTDPNIFKVFHIGHLMSNAIGESISRLLQFSGLKVVRICYPSDIGLHIAKAIWAMQKNLSSVPAESASIIEKTAFLGKMYVEGTVAYENEGDDIDALNKILYEKSSPEINALYEKGKKWSLEHFNKLYEILGTKFDENIFESDMAPVGLEIVREFLKKGIFEESHDAIVFKGEPYGLHTRVFVNSKGIPTYEAKDLGLNVTKFEKYPDAEQSIIVTAREQNDYFKVLTKVISLIDEKNGKKTLHIGHGMMRFADGKMSSRTGNVVTADSLLQDIRQLVREKMKDVGEKFEEGFTGQHEEKIIDQIAVGAIKYSILRSSIGSDIIFDSASSISFEGDSGPYLQYSAVRAGSVLKKGGINLQGDFKEGDNDVINNGHQSRVDSFSSFPEVAGLLEKLLVRFPEIAVRARNEYGPQIIANYLISLAAAFNSFYATQKIFDETDPLSPYRLKLTKAFKSVMTKGLWLLGIEVPERM